MFLEANFFFKLFFTFDIILAVTDWESPSWTLSSSCWLFLYNSIYFCLSWSFSYCYSDIFCFFFNADLSVHILILWIIATIDILSKLPKLKIKPTEITIIIDQPVMYRASGSLTRPVWHSKLLKRTRIRNSLPNSIPRLLLVSKGLSKPCSAMRVSELKWMKRNYTNGLPSPKVMIAPSARRRPIEQIRVTMADSASLCTT